MLLPDILKTAVSRLSGEIWNNFFYARLLGVFLAAFHNNAATTCEILSTIQVTPE